MNPVCYQAIRQEGGQVVWREDDHGCKKLDPRNDLRDHSPDGFEWNYNGSGPAQLALAIVADHIHNDTEALRLYQHFKRAVIAHLPREQWQLTQYEVEEVLNSIRQRSFEVSKEGLPF
tara:strand:+ start:1225 stop:1578 length:354 start_codon:yes stop_codon:yes gene_type:complete